MKGKQITLKKQNLVSINHKSHLTFMQTQCYKKRIEATLKKQCETYVDFVVGESFEISNGGTESSRHFKSDCGRIVPPKRTSDVMNRLT